MARDPIYDDLKSITQIEYDARRASNLTDANAQDDGLWTRHSEYHWSRFVGGKRLDYWPTKAKWQYMGRIRHDDVVSYIRAQEAAAPVAKPMGMMASITARRKPVRS